MIDETDNNSARIAELNDLFRQTFIGGRVMLTDGIAALSDDDREAIITKVRSFSDFTEDNDPWAEHDFAAFTCNGHRINWKIDCYDKAMNFGSEDPSDPSVTTRVLTILLASEY